MLFIPLPRKTGAEVFDNIYGGTPSEHGHQVERDGDHEKARMNPVHSWQQLDTVLRTSAITCPYQDAMTVNDGVPVIQFRSQTVHVTDQEDAFVVLVDVGSFVPRVFEHRPTIFHDQDCELIGDQNVRMKGRNPSRCEELSCTR